MFISDENRAVSKSQAQMLELLLELYRSARDEFNKQIVDASTSLRISQHEAAPVFAMGDGGAGGGTGEVCFAISNVQRTLLIVCRPDKFEAFLIEGNAENAALVKLKESRLKYSLRAYREGDKQLWLLNGVPLGEHDLRMLVLSTINALVQDVISDESIHLRLAETSLNSAVQSLILQRYQLSEALIRQQEQIFSRVSRDGRLFIAVAMMESTNSGMESPGVVLSAAAIRNDGGFTAVCL